MFITVTLNFILIFFISNNVKCQGRCRLSPGVPQETDVLRCARYLMTGLAEIKRPKIFPLYKVLSRDYEGISIISIFNKMAAFRKKNHFLSKFQP